jgi:hypothetical protein
MEAPMTTRQLLGTCAVLTLGLAASGCSTAGDGATCDDLRQIMAACYPDLPADAVCSDETLSRYSPEDFASMDCNEIDDAGKADTFATWGECPQGEHVCGWIFCCEDDYAMHWTPGPGDWDIVPYIDTYQGATPQWAIDELNAASYEDLLDAVSVTFDQSVDDGLGAGPRELAVEITTGVVPVDFETFLQSMSPDTWGVNLDHYLGGEVRLYERDAEGHVVRQAERMVLSPFPCDAESPLSNQDMTKVERIVWTPDLVTVYWRVMYSDNGSTETDIGTVSFARYGDFDTLVTFHSAHRLRTAIGTVIPNSLVRLTLSGFFSDHVREYREIVVGYR